MPKTELTTSHAGGEPIKLNCSARNNARDNFDASRWFTENAHAAEELETQVATAELGLEQTTAEALNHLRPTAYRQLRHAFLLCKLHFDGDVSQEFVDNYIAASGVKPHGNERIPYASLLKAVIVNARRKGAPVSKQSRSRISTYVSAINFALSLGWGPETFESHLRGDRRNGERHGLDFLAAEGRRHRRGMGPSQSLPLQIAMALDALGLQNGEFAMITVRKIANGIELLDLRKRSGDSGDGASAAQ